MDLNVFAEPLKECSTDPITGFTRTGCCSYHPDDAGKHLVCVKVTAEFLEYSRSAGNDLLSPVPEFGFPGLQPGNHWCLCAMRWQQALKDGCAPQVILAATHINVLQVCELEDLKRYAIDLA